MVAQVDKAINSSLSILKKNPILVDVLRLLGLAYVSQVVPPLPTYFTSPLASFWLRLLFIAAIIWAGNDKPVRSLIIAFVFLAGINILSGKDLTESFGLKGHILHKDTYYMQNRAEHEANFRKREWNRRDPNRVSAIVEQNNKRAESLLKDVSDENYKFKKFQKLNKDIDLVISTRNADSLRNMRYVPDNDQLLGSLVDSQAMVQPSMRQLHLN